MIPPNPYTAVSVALRGAAAALAAAGACLAGVYLLDLPARDLWLLAAGACLAKAARHGLTVLSHRLSRRTPHE